MSDHTEAAINAGVRALQEAHARIDHLRAELAAAHDTLQKRKADAFPNHSLIQVRATFINAKGDTWTSLVEWQAQEQYTSLLESIDCSMHRGGQVILRPA